MEDSPSRYYGSEVEAILIENSELAYEDRLAIVEAINKQTAVITELLTYLKVSQTLPQQNIPTPTVQNNYIEQSGREKLSKKLLATADWISANDPDLKLSVRQVATSAKVSIGTAQAAIKLVTDERSK